MGTSVILIALVGVSLLVYVLWERADRKKEAVGPIPPDLMEMYEQLRSAKEGVGVGRLTDGVCGGCNMALSSAEQAEALGAEPPRCVHCRRLLVG